MHMIFIGFNFLSSLVFFRYCNSPNWRIINFLLFIEIVGTKLNIAIILLFGQSYKF